MSNLIATFLVLDFVLCAAWMVHWFRVHRHPSLVGLTFLFAIIRYGVMAVSYAREPELPFPIPSTYPYFLAATFTCYVIGATAASLVASFDLPAAQRRFFAQSGDQGDTVNPALFGAVFVATMVIGVYFVTASERTGIEMLISYQGDVGVLRAFRQQFGASNPYTYAGSVVTQVVGPMVLMVGANVWRATGKMAWAAIAASTFVLLVFTSTASLSKAPIIVVVLYVLTNRFLSGWRGGAIRRSAILVPVTALLGLGTLGYAVTYGKSASDAFDDTISRIFIAPLISVHGFLHVYPNIVEFSNGLGIGLVAKFSGVNNFVTPDVQVGQIIAGPNTCFNSIWTTDLWANFGWAGVVIGSAGVGALLLGLDRWCLLRRRSAVTVALYSFMLVSSAQLSEGSIFTMLLSGGLVLAPVLAWLLEKSPA